MTAVLLAWLFVTAPPDVIDRIMAVVGTEPITLSDVSGARQFRLVDVPPAAAPSAHRSLAAAGTASYGFITSGGPVWPNASIPH